MMKDKMMKDKMMKDEMVLSSTRPLPRWGQWGAVAVGFLLVALGMNFKAFAPSRIFVGIVCVFIAGFERRTLLSMSGIVDEWGSWIFKRPKVLSWHDVDSFCVISSDDGKKAVRFFGKNVRRGFVLKDNDEARLRELVNRACPDLREENQE